MREALQHATIDDLKQLADILAESDSVSDAHADLFYAVVDELTERGEMLKTPKNDVAAFIEDIRRKALESQDAPVPSDEQEHPLVKHLPQILEDARKDRAERRQRRMRFFRPAIAAASMIVILLMVNAVALANGHDFLGSISRWTKDAVSFVFGVDSAEKPKQEMSKEYYSLKIMLDNLGIQVDLPMHMPDGFMFDSIEPDEPDDASNIVAWFVYLDDYFSISIKRLAGTSSERFSESDGEEYSEIYSKSNGQFMITTNNNRVKAIWYQGIYELKIQGSISYEQLTQIVDSIRKV